MAAERLAEIDRVDDFVEAIDADDVARATRLMKRAGVDAGPIATFVTKMEVADGEH